MMRTPDEIKKGLECCARVGHCYECQYKEECLHSVDDANPMHVDALAYIQQLEADKEHLGLLRAADAEAYRHKLSELKSRVPRWISVGSEEKPMHCKGYLCLCTLPNDPMHEWDYIAVLRWNGHGGNGYVNGPHFQHEGLEGMKVTHWMPLPEPPKEEHK